MIWKMELVIFAWLQGTLSIRRRLGSRCAIFFLAFFLVCFLYFSWPFSSFWNISQPFKRASCFPGLRKIWIDVRSFFQSKCMKKETVLEPEVSVDIDALVRQHKEEESEKEKARFFQKFNNKIFSLNLNLISNLNLWITLLKLVENLSQSDNWVGEFAQINVVV